MTHKINNKYQILLADFLIMFFTIGLLCISIKDPFIANRSFDLGGKYIYPVALPIFLVSIVGLGFGIFIQVKFNKLKIKNIFFLIGIIIAFNNFMMMVTLPSHALAATYNGISYYIDITIPERIFSIIIGFAIGFAPFLLLYVVPRGFLNKKYLYFFTLIFIALTSFFVLASFVVDFNSYVKIIKSGFSDLSSPVASILYNKMTFSNMLFTGALASIFMKIITKNWKWLLFGLLFAIINLFTTSKMNILLMIIFIIYYLFVLFYKKLKDRDNLIIFISVTTFVCLLIATFSAMIGFSQTGFLFKIKKILINIGESAKTTFGTRMTIWESAIKTLQPYQFIFGFGFYVGNIAMNMSYAHNPGLAEPPEKIFHCHNAIVECLQTGGIIYLLTYIFYLIVFFYLANKIYKNNKEYGLVIYASLVIVILTGVVENFILFADSQYIVFSTFFAVSIMSYYYLYVDDKNIRKKEIVEQGKSIQKVTFNNRLLSLNKKLIIWNAKEVAKETKVK